MNAVIYSRYSSDKQNASFSIEEQNSACIKKAELEGYSIIKVFEDKAQSAKTTNRPALVDMLSFVMDKKNDIDALYIYDISRLSRNQIDFSIIKRDVAEHGVTIRSVQGIPNDTVEGDLVQDLLARVVQYKNEIDAVKIKGGLYARFKAGLALHKVRGYDWLLNQQGRKTLVPDSNFKDYQLLWQVVREQRLTILQAVKYANEHIFKANFDRASMSRFLSNKLYCGILEYPTYVGEQVHGVHEPMITEELFYEVRSIIEGRSHLNTKVRNRFNPKYPLTKVLRCPSCEGKITAARSKGKRQYYDYYYCRNRETCRFNKQVEAVHVAFLNKLAELEFGDELITYIQERIREKHGERFNALGLSLDTVKRTLNKLQESKLILLDKLANGVIDDNEFLAYKNKLDIEIIANQTLVSEKQIDRTEIETMLNFLKFYLKNIQKIWLRYPIEVKIAIECSLFPKGVYFENGNCRTPEISPVFKLKEQFAASMSQSVLRM